MSELSVTLRRQLAKELTRERAGKVDTTAYSQKVDKDSGLTSGNGNQGQKSPSVTKSNIRALMESPLRSLPKEADQPMSIFTPTPAE